MVLKLEKFLFFCIFFTGWPKGGFEPHRRGIPALGVTTIDDEVKIRAACTAFMSADKG